MLPAQRASEMAELTRRAREAREEAMDVDGVSDDASIEAACDAVAAEGQPACLPPVWTDPVPGDEGPARRQPHLTWLKQETRVVNAVVGECVECTVCAAAAGASLSDVQQRRQDRLAELEGLKPLLDRQFRSGYPEARTKQGCPLKPGTYYAVSRGWVRQWRVWAYAGVLARNKKKAQLLATGGRGGGEWLVWGGGVGVGGGGG